MTTLRLAFSLGAILSLAACGATADNGGSNPPPPPPSAPSMTLTVVAGQDQVANWADSVPIRPAVLLKDSGGHAVAGATVTFTTGPRYGAVTNTAQVTGNDGIASAGIWTMGLPTGAKVLTASAVGASSVEIVANAVAMAQSEKLSGFDQAGPAGTAVLDVPAVRLSLMGDGANVLMVGAVVKFSVTAGGGSITGATATTDNYGVARVGSWTLGPQPGTNKLSATVTWPGARPMTFTATGTP